MINLLMAMAVLAAQQDPPPPPRPDPPPLRQDRRDPFDGPQRPGQPPNPPLPPMREGDRRPAQPAIDPEAVKAWLQQNEPNTYKAYADAQAANRQPEATRILIEAAPRMREMESMKQRDPKGYEKAVEMHRLERESQGLADAARRAPPEEREAHSKKLKETLDKLFDLREEMRARELAELKRRVEALEKAVADRKASKDRIVEKRRRELLGEKSEDDW